MSRPYCCGEHRAQGRREGERSERHRDGPSTGGDTEVGTVVVSASSGARKDGAGTLPVGPSPRVHTEVLQRSRAPQGDPGAHTQGLPRTSSVAALSTGEGSGADQQRPRAQHHDGLVMSTDLSTPLPGAG